MLNKLFFSRTISPFNIFTKMAFARRTKPLLGSHRMVKNNVLTQNELETLFDPKFITEAIKERTQYKEIVKDDERTFQDIERKTTSMIANDESGKQIQVDYKLK